MKPTLSQQAQAALQEMIDDSDTYLTYGPEAQAELQAYCQAVLESDAVKAVVEQGNVATVWRFQDAPYALQDLSTNGGDEDWIVELPKEYDIYGTPNWVMRMDACCEPKDYPHPTKPHYVVYIGSHA